MPSAPSRRHDPYLLCSPGEKETLELQNQASVFLFVSGFFEHDAERNPFTRGTLLQLHQLTIQNIFPCAGGFRDATSTIKVAGASFTPPPPYRIEAEIASILDDATAARRLRETAENGTKMEKLTELFHRFVVLHPFNGGNGRVGRALLHLALYDLGLLSPPDEIFSYVARRRNAYLRALRFADHGDFSPLREFFWRAIVDKSIEYLMADIRKKAKRFGYRLGYSRALTRFHAPSNRHRLSDDTYLRRLEEFFGVVEEFTSWLKRDISATPSALVNSE